MNNRIARIAGRIMEIVGLILFLFKFLIPGIALVLLGLGVIIIWGRCPHCGRILLDVRMNGVTCPACGKDL